MENLSGYLQLLNFSYQIVVNLTNNVIKTYRGVHLFKISSLSTS